MVLDKKIQDVVAKGQGAFAHLRSCRPIYHVYNDIFFSSSATLNEDFKKLVPRPQASKSSIKTLMEDHMKLEKALQGLQATQSFSGWLLDGIHKEIRRTNFSPVEPDLFDRMNKFLALSLVEGMNLSSSIFAYLRLHRREHFAAEPPSLLSEGQRKSLLSSSLSNEKLFDNDLILRLAEEIKSEASADANIEMSKTLPKLTSALYSSTSSSRRRNQQMSSRQPSNRRGRISGSSRYDRRRSTSFRSQRRPRGTPGRGRSSFKQKRGSTKSGGQHQQQPPFQK